MLSFEPEISSLRDEGLLRSDVAAALIARERREIVSVHTELRVTAWLGVMLLTGGVGVIVTKNFDRIGPVAIAAAIGAVSAACYGFVVWRRRTAAPTAMQDAVLLLAALLLSADAGYLESQFHLLGSSWPKHFLLLALIHGATAYVFDSAALLSLSIAAFASWLGIERNAETFFADSFRTAMRAFVCSGVVLVWRVVDEALRRSRSFERVFDHFIANFAVWGGLILTFRSSTREVGTGLVIVLAFATIVYGFLKREETFVIYSYVYAVIAAGVLLRPTGVTAILSFLIVYTVAAITGLFVLHGRFRKAAS